MVASRTCAVVEIIRQGAAHVAAIPRLISGVPPPLVNLVDDDRQRQALERRPSPGHGGGQHLQPLWRRVLALLCHPLHSASQSTSSSPCPTARVEMDTDSCTAAASPVVRDDPPQA